MIIPRLLGLVGVVSSSLILRPPFQAPFGFVSPTAPISEVMHHVQSLPIEFDPAMKVNCLILGDEHACRDVLYRFLIQFDAPLTYTMFEYLPDTARIRRAMLSHHRRYLYNTWEDQNRAGVVREPAYDRSVTRTLSDALPPQRDIRFLLESELALIYRLGRLFSIIRANSDIARQVNFWPLYLSRHVPNPEILIESTLDTIVTFSIFLEACAFPHFASQLNASAALHAACETRAWSSISAITTSTSRFRVRDRFWSTLYPVQPGSIARAISVLPFEFNPSGKDYCYGSDSRDCLGIISEFSTTLGYGVRDRDDRMHVPAELLAYRRAMDSVDFPRLSGILELVNVTSLAAVAQRGNISTAVDGWTRTRRDVSAEAAETRAIAFFYDFVHSRKIINLRAWQDFWRFYFSASETTHLQSRMESFMKAAVLSENLRRALRHICATDEVQAQISGSNPPAERRMRIRHLCAELPGSINVVREELGIRTADMEILRTEWWSYDRLVEILLPRFAYRVGGVRYQVNIVQLGAARIFFISPQQQSRPITEFLRTRQPGEELEDCPVCQDAVPEGGEYADLPCSHTCCRSCMQRWAEVNPSCPLCRGPIFARNVRRRLG